MKLNALHPLATRLAAGLIYLYMRLVGLTCRVSISNESVWNEHIMQGHNIFAFWHNRLFFCVYYYCIRAQRQAPPPASILISMSRDGDYGEALVKILKQEDRTGIEQSWGSSCHS